MRECTRYTKGISMSAMSAYDDTHMHAFTNVRINYMYGAKWGFYGRYVTLKA